MKIPAIVNHQIIEDERPSRVTNQRYERDNFKTQIRNQKKMRLKYDPERKGLWN